MNTLKTTLANIGFNEHQIAVFIALFTLGPSQAGALVKHTKLHRMKVYKALEDLESNGFVKTTHKKNIKIFEPTNPENIVKVQKRKLEDAKSAAEYLQRNFAVPQSLEIKEYTGPEGHFTNLREIIASAAQSKSKIMRIIGGASAEDFYKTLSSNYQDYIVLLEKHKIKKWLLATDTKSKEFFKNFANEKNTVLKTIHQGLETPAFTRITHEIVSIEFFHPTVKVIQITNTVFAKSYSDNFDLIWNKS